MDPPDPSETLAKLRQMFVEMAISAQQMLWLAQQAEIEGLPDPAAALRAKAAADSGHAQAMLDHLAEVDPRSVGAPAGSIAPVESVVLEGSGDPTVADVVARVVLPAASEMLERLIDTAAEARRAGHGVVAESLDSAAASQRRHLEAISAAIGASTSADAQER